VGLLGEGPEVESGPGYILPALSFRSQG
jgi:hypothetical protein